MSEAVNTLSGYALATHNQAPTHNPVMQVMHFEGAGRITTKHSFRAIESMYLERGYEVMQVMQQLFLCPILGRPVHVLITCITERLRAIYAENRRKENA
jgi:hypothetical protein